MVLLIVGGCDSNGEASGDETVAGVGGGGSGNGAMGGTSTGGKASGSSGKGSGGGSGSTQGGSSTGGTECSGDAETFERLTRGPIVCETNSDCCVVIDSCLTEARIVRAGDEEAAQAAWPYCDDYRTDCIPPAVRVGCRDGVCVGTELDDEDFESPRRQTHCGTDDEVMSEGTGDPFGCG